MFYFDFIFTAKNVNNKNFLIFYPHFYFFTIIFVFKDKDILIFIRANMPGQMNLCQFLRIFIKIFIIGQFFCKSVIEKLIFKNRENSLG